MLTIRNRSVISIGEVMVELAPVGGGLYRKGFAGDTFNTVWHIAQLLGPAVRAGYVTGVGQDKLSDAFLSEAGADGLDMAGCFQVPGRTMGLYLIDLDGVERSFTYWRSASAAKTLADDRDRLQRAVDGAGLIHLSGITLAILPVAAREVLFEVLAEARKAGAVVSFDPNIRAQLWASDAEIHQTVAQMLRLTDIALPSFDDEKRHWGDANPEATLTRFAAVGVREVAVKNGADAVTFLTGDQRGTVPTPGVAAIKDTTGAGDAFNAGYLAARTLGQSVGQAIAAGQAVSAEVICTLGARADKARVRALARPLGMD